MADTTRGLHTTPTNNIIPSLRFGQVRSDYVYSEEYKPDFPRFPSFSHPVSEVDATEVNAAHQKPKNASARNRGNVTTNPQTIISRRVHHRRCNENIHEIATKQRTGDEYATVRRTLLKQTKTKERRKETIKMENIWSRDETKTMTPTWITSTNTFEKYLCFDSSA